MDFIQQWAPRCELPVTGFLARLGLGRSKWVGWKARYGRVTKLLELLDIRGSIVTIDPMGCQRAIAARIIAGEGDYALALKGNQSQLHEDVVAFFDYAQRRQLAKLEWDYHETIDKDHGRIEVGRYWTVASLDWLQGKDKWAGLRLIGKVESERHIDGEVSQETRALIIVPTTAPL